MSRTWRKDERRERRRGERTCSRETDFGGREERVGHEVRPNEITPEWAIERMARHVDYTLEKLLANGVILLADKEDYRQMINVQIWKSLEHFYPDGRQKGVRSASIVHYLVRVVANEVSHIRECVERQRRLRNHLPLALILEEDGDRIVSEDALSDRCGSVRDLQFRMDVETLRSWLTPFELEILNLRVDGVGRERIMERYALTRGAFEKAVGRIQAKARRCGFLAKSDAYDLDIGICEREYRKKMEKSSASRALLP